MTWARFGIELLVSIIITSFIFMGWDMYQLKLTIRRLTADNERMRRYLRVISKRQDGDDMPFLPLEINDE
jgi:hypothetical protein